MAAFWQMQKFTDSPSLKFKKRNFFLKAYKIKLTDTIIIAMEKVLANLRPAGSDPEVVCQKNSFLKVSVSFGGFGPSVAHGKHSVRRRCVQATKNKAETCSLLDAIGRRSCGR